MTRKRKPRRRAAAARASSRPPVATRDVDTPAAPPPARTVVVEPSLTTFAPPDATRRTPRELSIVLAPPGPAAAAPQPLPAPLLPLRTRLQKRETMLELLVFRVGAELFGADLAAVEEAVELSAVQPLPKMPAMMLGIFSLRGRMTPLYDPTQALGIPIDAPRAALVLRADGRRLGIAVDDVEDVLSLEPSAVREPPTLKDPGPVFVGVTRRGSDLVTLIDADALLAACVAARDPETA